MLLQIAAVNALMIAQIEKSSNQILAAEILEEIYRRANIAFETVSLPGARAILASSTGQLDGEQMRIYQVGELYPDLIRVPTPYIYFEATAFSVRNDINIKGWSSLSPYHVARVRGIKFAALGLEGANKVTVLNNNEIMFNMLKHNRVDVAVSTKFSGLYQINQGGLDGVYVLTPPLERHYLYHYLHKKNRHLIPILDDVIKAMRQSGELEALRNRYYLALLKQAKDA
ncbi:hypothetical protein A9Q77_02425 [Marinomonas sp. 42_23_T18]|nr:hypothetical protein A9Q77_02425 [Marinomonas sp. 42_23_T18]